MFSVSRLLNKNKKIDTTIHVTPEPIVVWLEKDSRFASIANFLRIIQIEFNGQAYTLKLLVGKDFKDAILKTYTNVSLTYIDDWHVIKDIRLGALKALINRVVEAAYFASENKENKLDTRDMLIVTNLYVYIYRELGFECPYQLSEVPEIDIPLVSAEDATSNTIPSAKPAQMPPNIPAVLFPTDFGLFATPRDPDALPSEDTSADSYCSSSSDVSTPTLVTHSLIRDKISSPTSLQSPDRNVYGPLFSNNTTTALPSSSDSVSPKMQR